MVCEVANNGFSNSFEMKGQFKNALKLPALICDCVWVSKYEDKNEGWFNGRNDKKQTF